jgi:putative protein-disulfide isomerase
MGTLYYVYDPMCSWCYAFAPVLHRIEDSLPELISVEYVLGGLARDSDALMPTDLQNHVQENWRRIQAIVPGTEFNFDFWTGCKPRRSTYPACRAVLAAKSFEPKYEKMMIEKIQTAHYRQAKNPSNVETLCELAGEIGIDGDTFRERIKSPNCQAMLEEHLQKRRSLGVTAFPSLVLESDHGTAAIPLDYADPNVTLSVLEN